ncbi:MAG: hypothetical protein ACK5UE_14240 [Chitinophagales bacterium]|jgi:hypothetical protein|nr:hypothetical protein [Sphingobacteriales bacterium]
MVFGQILKNVLDKNQSVWIPTIGLLGYDKATSKLGLDVYGSGSDNDLIHLISDIKQVSASEAKGILIQEVESLKSSVINQGKYSIEGLGDILFSNGSFQFESKKALFPTDFFGGGQFNPSTFKDNAPKEEANVFENTFIKVEAPKKPEPIIEEPKVEEIKKEIEYVIEPEQPKDLFEAAQLDKQEKEESKSFLSSVKDFFSTVSNKVEDTVEDIKETAEEVTTKADEKLGNLVEEITPDFLISQKDEVKEEDFTTRILNEISEEETEEDDLDEIEEEINEEETEDIFETPKPPIIEEPKSIVIDEPRRKIGNSSYDEGHYKYDLSAEDDKPNRWPLVAGISLGFIAAGFLIAWIIASFQGKQLVGLKPLWETKKAEIKKVKPALVAAVDTAKIDTTNALVNAIMDSTINEVVAKVETTTPASAAHTPTVKSTPKAAPTTVAAPSKTSSTSSAQATIKNTPTPKTPTSTNPVGKKTVAVATEKTKKSESVTSSKEAASISPTKEPMVKKEKDTTSKPTLAKAEKVNIIGKPFATANYTKGNYYLSFGKFKIAAAAVKLKNDMKKKAGIETDIILLDGTYRVVVPYLSKEKAESASRDYVSTTLFE